MPEYTFRCRKCGRITRATHGFGEPHPEFCQCGHPLQRVWDAPNVVYRGSGFYSTDKVLYDPVEDDDE